MTGTFSDPAQGNQQHPDVGATRWTINWGDGTAATVFQGGTGGIIDEATVTAAHIYSEVGTYQVEMNAGYTNSNSTYSDAAEQTATVVVNEVTPSFTVGGAASGNDGDRY